MSRFVCVPLCLSYLFSATIILLLVTSIEHCDFSIPLDIGKQVAF